MTGRHAAMRRLCVPCRSACAKTPDISITLLPLPVPGPAGANRRIRSTFGYFSFAVLILFASAACSGEAAKKNVEVASAEQVILIPGQTDQYAQHDVQIRLEIENAYLMSWFTWPVRQPVSQVSFLIDLRNMEAGPRYEAGRDLDAMPDMALVTYVLAPADMLEIRANPSHPDYSPPIEIGDQPISDRKFGLDVRYNNWLEASGGPTNELYTSFEDQHVALTVLCKEGVSASGRPKYCLMQFPLRGVRTEARSDRYAPFVRVSFQESHLANWSEIIAESSAFLRERSSIVPFGTTGKEGVAR